MILAAAEYREFIKSYPYSPSAAYCQYQAGMTFYKKALKPGRDQMKTAQALIEFRLLLKDYPGSEQAKPAQQRIAECEERMAEHTFIIGKEYHNERAYKAAADRLNEILTTYPNYSRMDQAYFYLGDSYFRWKKYDQAVPYLTKLVTDYPKSGFAKKAQERLKEINRTVPAKGKG
jgi:outer membrane protein assembly factor BamD